MPRQAAAQGLFSKLKNDARSQSTKKENKKSQRQPDSSNKKLQEDYFAGIDTNF